MPGFLGYRNMDNKKMLQLVFWSVTLVMLTARYASFYTFKGSDDLHYAFLSSSVLNGSYDMFVASDIYSGRAVVILYQALWFKLFGINEFSMCMPSLSILIILAYLVCFKCGLQKNIHTVLLGSALIYFNPVVTRSTLGNLPDVYIALIAVLVFLLIKKSTQSLSIKRNILWGSVTALLLVGGLFVKENIVLIYAGATIVLFYYRQKISGQYLASLGLAFSIGCVGYLFFYYLNTGDLFYRFVQIKNSSYFNPCSYQCLPQTELLKRLTITIPLVAVITGAYPLLLLASVLFIPKQQINRGARFWEISLITLLLLALYFPFSIVPYVPLCHDMRQFFFLFPFAAIIYLASIGDETLTNKQVERIYISGSIIFLIVTLTCVLFTPYNKWGIFCNILLALSFITGIFIGKKVQQFLMYLVIPFILWLSTAYPIFKKPHEGYPELKAMQASLKQESSFISSNYYFLSNDTKTHFALINRFDTTMKFLNLDTVQKGFKPFIAYQPQNTFTRPVAIQKGWLIVSEHYFENLDAGKIASIRTLLLPMQPYLRINKTSAYFISSEETIKKLMGIINTKTTDQGCY